MASAMLTMENEVFAKFAFYSGAVLLKTLVMSAWTAKHRIFKNVFASPEDFALSGSEVKITTDPDVERIRRCHLNDLENVLPFVLIGQLYVLTGPDVTTATSLFRVFAASRLLHTLAYVFAIPQPCRVVCFTFGYVVNITMAVAVLRAAPY